MSATFSCRKIVDPKPFILCQIASEGRRHEGYDRERFQAVLRPRSAVSNATQYIEDYLSSLCRTLTYSYLAAFNVGMMLYPAVLSYDWQMGSVPIVQTMWDVRNLATVALLMALSKVAWLIVSSDFNSSSSSSSNVVVSHKKTESPELLGDHEDSGSEASVRLVRSSGGPALEDNDDDSPSLPEAQSCGPSLLLMSVALLSFSYMPASNFFVTVGFVVAERVLYIPSMGFCLLVVEGFRRLLNYSRLRSCDSERYRRILLICIIAFTVCHAVRTIRRNQVWRSRATLFE